MNKNPILEDKLWTRKDRLEDIKRLGETIGLWNINKAELSKKHKVCLKTTQNDINAVFKRGIDRDSVLKATVNIDNLNKSLLTNLQVQYFKANNAKDRVAIARTLIDLEEKMADFLERFGFKDIQSPSTDSHITVSWGKKKDDEKG